MKEGSGLVKVLKSLIETKLLRYLDSDQNGETILLYKTKRRLRKARVNFSRLHLLWGRKENRGGKGRYEVGVKNHGFQKKGMSPNPGRKEGR